MIMMDCQCLSARVLLPEYTLVIANCFEKRTDSQPDSVLHSNVAGPLCWLSVQS